jgi:hypothetical protein
MGIPSALDCLCNCFWLLVPILVFNLVFARQLPPAYQADVFESAIPLGITIPENVFRAMVMLLPLVMRPRASTQSQKLGLGLYLAGVLVYFASWGVLIVAPRSAWSISALGFMAPAYTPILWLVGIGLIGDVLVFPRAFFGPWMYWALSALFLLFHNLHTAIVYSRGV